LYTNLTCTVVCNDGILGDNECYEGEGCSNATCTCIAGYELGIHIHNYYAMLPTLSDIVQFLTTISFAGFDHVCSKIVTVVPSTPVSLNSPFSGITPSSGITDGTVPTDVIVPAIVVPVVVVLGVGVFLIIFFMRRQKKKHTIASINMENISKYASLEDRMSVPYKQIKFIKEIGSGGFGKVYIGGTGHNNYHYGTYLICSFS
jgi:hypothetical protein